MDEKQRQEIASNLSHFFGKLAENLRKIFLAWNIKARAILDTIKEDAEKGDPAAKRFLMKLEIERHRLHVKEIEKKLGVTRKTTARKPLIERRKALLKHIWKLEDELQEIAEGREEDEEDS